MSAKQCRGFEMRLRPWAWTPNGDYRECFRGGIDYMAHLRLTCMQST